MTETQARALKEARDTAGGLYCPITGGVYGAAAFDYLVAEGYADWRDVPQVGEGYGRNGEALRWTDTYIVPTEKGLAYLAAHGA